MKALIREVVHVNRVANLSDADIARATGAAPSTVRAWVSESRSPSGERAERLIELSALVARLERLMDADYIAPWLREPIAALDDERPLDLIGRGDYRAVAAAISSLEDPPAV